MRRRAHRRLVVCGVEGGGGGDGGVCMCVPKIPQFLYINMIKQIN